MQHRGDADPGSEPLLVGGDPHCRLGGSLEQDVVDDGLVGVGEIGDRRGERVDDMEVGDGQQLGLAFLEPQACRRALTLGAMPIAAGVVGDDGVTARSVLAARNMAAKRGRAAALDRAHHLHLGKAHVAAVGLTPSATVIAEDVRDLQRCGRHVVRSLCHRLAAGLGPASPALGLVRHLQLVEWAFHRRDEARCDARVARRRLQLLVPQ